MTDKKLDITMDEDLELWILLSQAVQCIGKLRESELRQYGISLQQCSILFLINTVISMGKEARMHEIAALSLLEKHSISEIIQRMQKKGLVKKIKDDLGVKVELTDNGLKTLELSLIRESTKLLFSSFSAQQTQQLKQLIKTLRDGAMDLLHSSRKLSFP